MAKRAKTTKRVDGLFRELVGELVDARLRKLDGAEGLARLLRSIERRLDALERKVTRLASGSRSRTASGKKPGRPPLHERCLVEGCGADHYALGLCSRHYQQWRRGRKDLQAIVDRAKAAAGKKAGGRAPGTSRKASRKGGRKADH